MALTFPTSASMMDTASPSPTPTPTSSSRTQSQLFVGSTATTTQGGNGNGNNGGNNNGSGWFGSGGSSTSAYFQTVIISLVALAVLLIISVAFLYYRRRRLRLYSSADWPFQDRHPGSGSLFFPGGAGGGGGPGGRSGKESKELGEKPDMWQVLLDTDEKRVGGRAVVMLVGGDAPVAGSSEERERREDEEDRAGLLERWLPLSVTSMTTTQASVPASDAATNATGTSGTTGAGNTGQGGSSSRPTGMFGRGFSSSHLGGGTAGLRSGLAAHNSAHDSLSHPYANDHDLPSATNNNNNNNNNGDNNGAPSTLPIHLTFIIAMPTDPSIIVPAAPAPVRTYDGYDEDDEEGRDIPNVELGTTIIDLDLSTDGSPSPSFPPPSSYPPPMRPTGESGGSGTLTPSRHTSLGQVLGLTSGEPGPIPIASSTGYSLRDTLGLPRPVQRARRERRRDRAEVGMIRI